MTRYVKPDANKIQVASDKMMKMGDDVGFQMTSALVGLTSFIAACVLVVESLFFLLLMLPAIPVAVIWASYYFTTVQLGSTYGRDLMYEDCVREYHKMIGDHTKELAKPIIDKVLEHAQVTHVGGGTRSTLYDYKDCSVCSPRLEVLKELAPESKSVESDDDIKQAQLFLQARKEITGS